MLSRSDDDFGSNIGNARNCNTSPTIITKKKTKNNNNNCKRYC